MTFTEEQTAEAKKEAIEFLEFTILRLAILLALDVDDIDENIEIPEDEEHPEYEAFRCLKKQLSIHSSLTSN